MKALLVTVFMLSLSSFTFAAESITCVGPHQDQLTIVRNDQNAGVFQVNIDEGLSSQYLGQIEDRNLSQDASATADIISDWDGNSGVKISMRKGFLAAAVGSQSKGFLTIKYDDIDTDYVSYTLTCEVTK